tara:strand:+ start:202 stop:618 length:417 start_codon:yes stop_codon:yes gene_type:complete
MKLNKETLKQIIKEELESFLSEDVRDDEGRLDSASAHDLGSAYDMLGPINATTTVEEIKEMIIDAVGDNQDTVLFQLAMVLFKNPSVTAIQSAVDELGMSNEFKGHLNYAEKSAKSDAKRREREARAAERRAAMFGKN